MDSHRQHLRVFAESRIENVCHERLEADVKKTEHSEYLVPLVVAVVNHLRPTTPIAM